MSTIQLRRHRPDDVDAICEAVVESRTELSMWMSWCHPEYSRQNAATWLEAQPGAWERNEERNFLIVDTSDRLLGSCGIHRMDVRNQVAELGYWVRSSVTRRGVATEAVRQLSQWAFREGGLHRIEIVVSVENAASQRVADKAGGIREGILRDRILLHGRRHDCVLFSILHEQH